MKTLKEQSIIRPFRTNGCQPVTPSGCFRVPVIEAIALNVPEVSVMLAVLGPALALDFIAFKVNSRRGK